MILDNHYAVVLSPYPNGPRAKMVLSMVGYEAAVRLTQEPDSGIVILEAWDITKGKCVSN